MKFARLLPILTALLGLLAPVGARALTCESGICPEWVNGAYSMEPNATYLNDTRRRTSREEQDAFQNWIFPADRARGMRQGYELQTRPVEQRREAGILSLPEQMAATDQSKNYGFTVARSVLSYQFTEGVKASQQRSEGVRTFAKSYETVGQIASGNNQLAADEKLGFKFGSHTNIPSQQGRIWMESKLVNAQFDMNFSRSAGGATLWGNNLNLDPAETYRLAFNRNLVLGFDAGVVYGTTTSRMTTNLGRPLGRGLRFDLVNSRGLDPAAGILPEDLVKLQYGVQF